MTRTKPPFRADHVGSILRSEKIKAARKLREEGAITAEELTDRANVHLKTVYGRSNHHKIEALFKAFARALRVACSRDKQLAKMLPSTKGLL